MYIFSYPAFIEFHVTNHGVTNKKVNDNPI